MKNLLMRIEKKPLATWALALCCAAPIAASAGCLDQKQLTGVNLAGAEFNSGKLPGIVYKDYTYPTESELTYIAAQGANVIRLPFRWERVQRTPGGALDDGEIKRMQATVASANAKGLCVILDMHNYAKYSTEVLAGNQILQDAFVDAWKRLALVFNDSKGVAFGLMNEPNYLPIADWAALAKRALTDLRNAGASNLILIGGGRWSGLHDFFSPQNGTSSATAFAGLKDPLKRTAIEVHQYADKGYSGTGTDCIESSQFITMFTNISTWATSNNLQLFLGEFGLPQTDICMATLDKFLSLMSGPAWKGWTYWSAGGWWGKYALAVNTSTTEPSKQWPILKKYFVNQPITDKAPPSPPVPLRKK